MDWPPYQSSAHAVMDAHSPDDEASTSSSSAVQFPELAHIRSPHDSVFLDDTETDDDEELEATELRRLRDSVSSHLPPMSHILTDGKPLTHWYDFVRMFWRHHVRISVPHEDCRDHLANERTYLSYMRDSIALSIMGAAIAQLWRLEEPSDTANVFGYFLLSKPLSVIFHTAALCMSLLGAHRFFRQQTAMAIGKVHAGGWEINVIASVFLGLLVMMLAVHIAVDIYESSHPG